MKIIIGAGSVQMDGWLSLQFSDLDIRNEKNWHILFAPNSLDAILTEHTLEHLTESEAKAAVRNFYEFLRPNGYVRCAVPDGFHPDKNYLDWVAPDSSGERFLATFREPGEPNHKMLWNYHTLSKMFVRNKFKVRLLEFFDEAGELHKNFDSDEKGYIRRRAHSGWSEFLGLITNSNYTSLIVDAYKK